MEKTLRLLSENKINDNTVFYKEIENNEIINLGVRYFEDNKEFEDIKFFSYSYLSSMKYTIKISDENNIIVIENNNYVCIFSIELGRRIPTSILSKCNESVKQMVLEKK